jgi:septum formation topological specificity factor MinE
MAYKKAARLRDKVNLHDENYLDKFVETKLYPNMFAQAYNTAKLVNPNGHNTFVMNINRNNKQYDMVKRIRGQRRKIINFWMHTAKLTREIDKATGVDPSTYRPKRNNKKWRKKRPPSTNQITRQSTRPSHLNHTNTRRIIMTNLDPQPSHKSDHYHCHMAQERSTPSFINRLQRAMVPVIAAVQTTPNAVRTNQEQATPITLTASPPSIDTLDQHLNHDEASVDSSIAISDSPENVEALRTELAEITAGHVNSLPSTSKQETTHRQEGETIPTAIERKKLPFKNKKK